MHHPEKWKRAGKSNIIKQLLRRRDSNFLVFSEPFYIKRFKNKGYRYYLGREGTSPPPINTRESKADRKKRYNELMKKNNWTRAELSRYLGVSRVWISKVLNN